MNETKIYLFNSYLFVIFFRLVQKVGKRKALEMLCTSKVCSAEECLNFGLADKIISSVDRENEGLEYVRQFTNLHHSITRSYKNIVRVSDQKPFEEVLELERNEFYPKWGSKLNCEALQKNIKHVEHHKTDIIPLTNV